MSEILDDFIFDSREQLENAGARLMALEKDPHSLENVNALMGILHTIKGNSGFVNLRHLYELLHSAESLLQTARETPDHFLPAKVIEILFQVLDTVEAIMGRLENGEDDEVDWMGSLTEILSGVTAEMEKGQAGATGSPDPAAPRSLAKGPDPASPPPRDPEGGSASAAPPRVLAQPIKPAAPGELKTVQPRRKKGAKNAQSDSPEDSASPLGEKTPEPRAEGAPEGFPPEEGAPSFPDASGETAAGDLGLDGPLPFLALSDGLLAERGEDLLRASERLKKGGAAAGLVCDLREIGFITLEEVKVLEKLHAGWGDRLAFILDKELHPDLFRVFEVLQVNSVYRFFSGKEEALEALKAL
ncbi:MAG: Hpt domain-containing protein [Deltaproteobacteria bacterium]|nr:Hpt domain-containing protein [Deltaproteobacteria bacterium]